MSLLNKLKFVFNIDSDVDRTIDKNIEFGYRYGLYLANNHYEFETNKYRTSQIIKVIFTKSMTLMTIFRYLMTAMVPKKWMIVLMSDAMYLLGYNRLITYPLIRLSSFMFSMFALVIFSMTSFASMAELNNKCHMLGFMFKYRQRALPKLQYRYSERLAIYLGLFTKLIYPTFWPLNVISIGLMAGTTVQALFEHE